MNLNIELKKIYKKYNINNLLNISIQNIIIDIFKNIPSNSKVGFRGGGEHTKKILELIEPVQFQYFIFDQGNDGLLEYGINCYPCEQIIDFSLDYIVISSFKYRDEIRQELYRQNINANIIDIYSILECQGINITHSFYFYNTYPVAECIELQESYKSSKNYKKKKKILNRLIQIYLLKYDFVSAEKCITEYISFYTKDDNKYYFLMCEIKQLFEKVKKELIQKKTKDILIYWFDMLEYQELSNVSYLEKLKNNCIFFENGYTVTPTTFPTFQCMFSQKLRLNHPDYYSTGNGDVIKKLEKQGYSFCLIGIETENFIKLEREGFHFILKPRYTMCSEKFWEALCLLLNTNQPLCIVIHELAETHFPYLSPLLSHPIYDMTAYVDDFRGKTVSEQKKVSALYLSLQLEFYDTLLDYNNIKKVYMSDHGFQSDQYVKRYTEEATHILLMIRDKEKTIKCYKSLFSLYNFKEILNFICFSTISDIELFLPTCSYVIHEDIDYYSSRLITAVINAGIPEYGMAYLAIRTKEDMYVIIKNGMEYYFRLPDEINNNITNKKYKHRISFLKNILKIDCKILEDYKIPALSQKLYEY